MSLSTRSFSKRPSVRMRSGCATTPRVPPDREQTRNRKALSTVSSYRSLLQINLALGRSEIPLAVTLHQAPSVLRSMVDTLFFEMARLKSTASERQRTEQQQQPHSLEKQRSEESAAQTESRPMNGTQESAAQTDSLPVDSGQPVRIVHDPTDRQDALLVDQLRHENRLLAESLREMSSESTRLQLQLKSVQQQLADQDSGSTVRTNKETLLIKLSESVIPEPSAENDLCPERKIVELERLVDELQREVCMLAAASGRLFAGSDNMPHREQRSLKEELEETRQMAAQIEHERDGLAHERDELYRETCVLQRELSVLQRGKHHRQQEREKVLRLRDVWLQEKAG